MLKHCCTVVSEIRDIVFSTTVTHLGQMYFFSESLILKLEITYIHTYLFASIISVQIWSQSKVLNYAMHLSYHNQQYIHNTTNIIY